MFWLRHLLLLIVLVCYSCYSPHEGVEMREGEYIFVNTLTHIPDTVFDSFSFDINVDGPDQNYILSHKSDYSISFSDSMVHINLSHADIGFHSLMIYVSNDVAVTDSLEVRFMCIDSLVDGFLPITKGNRWVYERAILPTGKASNYEGITKKRTEITIDSTLCDSVFVSFLDSIKTTEYPGSPDTLLRVVDTQYVFDDVTQLYSTDWPGNFAFTTPEKSLMQLLSLGAKEEALFIHSETPKSEWYRHFFYQKDYGLIFAYALEHEGSVGYGKEFYYRLVESNGEKYDTASLKNNDTFQKIPPCNDLQW